MLKEWIKSTEEPLEEDVTELKNFLLELIDTNVPKVEILMKFLFRMAQKRNEKWEDVYLTILSSVEEKIKLKR
ncbi:hypothetical protein TNIN_373721 [Trichonephila inaurata madagascariensis]|uniref:DNA repair protein Rev1 C-terminal domain-containing protein n=1 Tax=Trichonephila inaurata madagascariensis TaxID=2747483 RepID=A0A8X6YJ66_9ARAC|nr:hypothetical protein TNIN_373721 [Trichonephila inaurata madagascariensis]